MTRCPHCGRRRQGPHGCPDRASPAPAQGGTPELPELPGYRCERVIGRGGFGTVFAATRLADEALLAVKVAHVEVEGATQRLLREAEAVRAVGPPFVPVLHQLGRLHDGCPFLAMEYIALPTLSNRLENWPEGTVDEACGAVADAILVALEGVHARGLVHRDVKPENIFVDEPGGLAKLIDFGIARPAGERSRDDALTRTGMLLGSFEYMAPEQCEGQSDIDTRADLYAMGVVLYEMLTGRPPFLGTTIELSEAHLYRRPAPPSSLAPVSPELDHVVLRCLAKRPDQRYQEVAELRAALRDAWAAGTRPRAARVASRDRKPSRPERKRQLMGALFFATSAEQRAIQREVAVTGGQLVPLGGRRHVAAFGREIARNPVARALDSARALIRAKLVTRVRVDCVRVQGRRGPDGTQRLVSATFWQDSRYPADSDPHGVVVTASAAEALDDVELTAVPGREGLLQPVESATAADSIALSATHSDSRPFVGRAELLHRLVAGAGEAIERRAPGIVTVLAEAGHGKTHLVAVLAERLRAQYPSARILQLRAVEPIGGEDRETLRALLSGALALADTTVTSCPDLMADRLGRHTGQEMGSVMAMIMGRIAPDAPEVQRLGAAPGALRAAAMRAAGEALRGLARAGPLLCIVDDAQFADETALDALEYATLAEAGLPIWVCALARPSFARARPSWATRAATAETLRLGSLAGADAEALCRQLLQPASNVADQVVERLLARTEGSPLLIVELARGLKRQGLIRKHASKDAWYLASDELQDAADLPLVEWLAEREMAALPDDLADHARLLAILGPEFAVPQVEGTLHRLEAMGLGWQFPLDAWAAIGRLLDRRLLTRRGDGRLGFRHALIREHVARQVPEALRRHIHEAAYGYYRAASTLTDDERLPLVAHHAAHSGHIATAATLYLELGERARKRHDYLDAESMYSRALALQSDRRDAAALSGYRGRGQIRYRLARFKDALGDLGHARAIAGELRDTIAEIELLLEEATALDWMHEYPRSRERMERARDIAADLAPPLVAARLAHAMARSLYRFGQVEDAAERFEEVAALAGTLGDAGYELEITSLMLLGSIHCERDRLDEAEAVFERAMALCEDRGDRLHLAAALNNRRELWAARGDLTRATADTLACRQIGRELGQPELEYVASYNLAELYYHGGDLAAAWPYVRRARATEARNTAYPLALILEARMLAYEDRRDQVRAALREIRAAQAAAGGGPGGPGFLASCDTLCVMLDLATRDASGEEWSELITRSERTSSLVDRIEILEMRALSELRGGFPIRAAALLDEALAITRRVPVLIEGRIRQHWLRIRNRPEA